MATITIAETLFNSIDQSTNSVIASDVSKIITFAGGVIGGLYMVYMLAKLLIYINQGLDYAFKDWLLNMLKCCAITFVAVGNGYYIGTVVPVIVTFPDALSSTVTSSGSSSGQLVDSILNQGVDLLSNSFQALPAPWSAFGAFLLGVVGILFYIIGAFPFLSVVVATLVVNKMAVTLFAIVGPIFIMCLLISHFSSWFFNWLGYIFTFSVTQLFFTICISIEFAFVQTNLIDKLGDGAITLADGFSMFIVFSSFLVLAAAIPAFASGLFGGHGGSLTDGLGSMPMIGRPIQLARSLGQAGGSRVSTFLASKFKSKIGNKIS